ncbi:LrgB family protein [Aestuariimicrobium ganziense]|uniref:LrgB family protein n=1 Tax=Aestuariimicrobium ganziense TaxID=2773677 RepID=UPI0019432F41|nr:LrgB family protein [Aestuariimicrobium ganziense]
MNERLDQTWAWLSTSPLLALALTVGTYWLAEKLWDRLGRRALLTPLLVTVVVIGVVLVVLRIDYATYAEGAKILTFLLGPATVALALPLHRQLKLVQRAAPMVLGAVTAGAVLSVLAGYWVVRALGGTAELAASMAPKSATAPIAMPLAEQIGGVASIAVAFVMVSGLSGAVLGPKLLDLARVTDPRARGLAMGVSSHGIGTSRALLEGETQGAFSGLAMGLTGLTISLVITWLVPG